jgi:hypothetical protein
MGPWATYDLADFLLFSPETYARLMERYNAALWPLQLAALALGLAAGLGLVRPSSRRGRPAALVFAVGWLWVAWGYHLQRYTLINWAAPWFAALFAFEAALLAWFGACRGRLDAGPGNPIRRPVGLGLYSFGLAAYPFLYPLYGHDWARSELFGVAPDPTAVGTLGILLLMKGKGAWLLWPAPILWCLLSGATLRALGAPIAILPPAAAVLAVAVAVAGIRWDASRKAGHHG